MSVPMTPTAGMTPIEGDSRRAMAEIAPLMRIAPRAFLHWWFGELGSLLPGWLTSTPGRARAALVLDVRARGAALRLRRPKRSQILGEISEDEDAQPLLHLSARRYRRLPLVVRLAADLGMRKVVDLPLAAKGEIGNLLRFELDRLTPFAPEDVYLAWRVVDADQTSGRMSVALEMAPRALVDKATEQVAALGRSVDRVEIGGADEAFPLNLLSQGAEAESGGRFGGLPPLIVLILAVIAVWVPINRQERAIDRLDGDLTMAQSAANETIAMQEQLKAEAKEAGFLADAKRQQASMTHLLSELTRLVPDHGHIVQLEIAGDSVQINGFADRASDLITILDRSTIFTAPTFRSAVTRDPRSGKERFQIGVELAERSS